MRLERWLYVLPLRLRSLVRRSRVEQELDDELRYHLERQSAEHVARGMSPEAAHTAALRALGGVEFRKEQVRDTRGTRWLEELVQDLHYTARTLRRSPAFTIVAVLTLALGIGANTAIFTLLDAVMLRSLPVRDPGSLVIVQRMSRAPDGVVSPRAMPYPSFKQMQRDNTVMERMAAFATTASVSIQLGGEAELLSHGVALVTGDFFPMLGLTARAGRLLGPGDDRVVGGHPVAVVSHDYWMSHLGGDASVVGRRIAVNETPFTVVGVAPAGFFGISLGSNPDLYVPMMMAAPINRSPDVMEPSHGFLSVIGRLRPGVGAPQAAQQLGPLYIRARIETGGEVADEQTLKRFEGTTVAVQPGAQGLSYLRAQFGKPLVVLMTMVGLVLLVACGNIANLLVARAAVRRREVGIRLSVGAGRSRLMRQLLTESLVLSLLGGALGVGVAQFGDRFLITLLGGSSAWLSLDVSPDVRVLAFVFAVSLATGLAFGLAPALGATRVDLASVLRESGRGTLGSRGQARFGRGLVVAQVALSIVLLVGTGLFVRSLGALRAIDVGFSRDNIVVARMDARRQGYRGARLTSLYRDLLRQASRLPGISSAALADITPLSGSSSASDMSVEGYTPPPGDRTNVFIIRATPEYFATIGHPLRAGALFDGGNEGARSTSIVVNEAFLRHFAPYAAIGRRVGSGSRPGTSLTMTIVGVVKDAPLRFLRENPLPIIYRPLLADTSTLSTASLVLRTSAPTESVVRELREILRGVDTRLELLQVTTLVDQIESTIVSERLVATIATFFGGLALVLASIGLYGVVSQNVARRTNEIGIRMALGASRAGVSWRILRDALLTVVTGVAIGIPLSLAASRGVSSLLFGVSATDAATIVTCVATLLAVAVVASYLPAYRASRIDPVSALRAD